MIKTTPIRNQSSSGSNRFAGFTLLEVLLASALTTLLLVSVYQAVNIYLKAQTSGREQMARNQLARAIFKQMQGDIKSTLFVLPEPVEEEDEESDSEEDSETSSLAEDSQLEEAITELTFLGDSQSLIIHASRPLRDLRYVENGLQATVLDRTSDRVEIHYFLADSANTSASATVQATPTTVSPGASLIGVSSNGPQGLVRIEADPFMMASGDAVLDETVARIIAPEVNYLEFVYYDGQDPVDYWDSREMGGLPSAVEIVIGFRPQREFSARETLSGYGAEPEQTYRIVVPMPLSQPYVTEEEL